MKTFTLLRRWIAIGPAFCLVLGVAAASAQPPANRIRIGVYDSRAVAVAYANSTEFSDANKGPLAEYEKARAAKDAKRMEEIRERMQLNQRRAHEQGFSTGSVIPIMTQARVKEALPGIAREARVEAIVSKWELHFAASDVEQVDVTDRIVALFHVNERGLKWAREIQQKTPLPIEEIINHAH